jgi:penicillin-binding protein-related factor A (putative recombinase)
MTKSVIPRTQVATEAKKAQDIICDVLKRLSESGGLVFERIPDSKSAGFGRGGNFISGRRGDFDGMANGKYFIIEVKNSMRHKSFRGVNIKSTFQPSQLAAAHNWGEQGAVCLAILRNADKTFHVVSTLYLVQCLATGRASCDVEGVLLNHKQALLDYLKVTFEL